MRIEEHETKNIPLEDFSDITVEHLMPKSLSKIWKNHLGAKRAEEIHNKYLGCIGNLTIVSKGYNSKMSNRIWKEKIVDLEKIQFAITTEITKDYPKKWDESAIKRRNESMSDRAVEAIPGPLPRERPYRTKDVEEYQKIFPISEVKLEVRSTPVALYYKGEMRECLRWKDLLVEISLILIKKDEQRFNEMVSRNLIHKATKKRNPPNKDPMFSTNKKNFSDPVHIYKKYYCEGALSGEYACKYANKLLELFNSVEDFTIEVEWISKVVREM